MVRSLMWFVRLKRRVRHGCVSQVLLGENVGNYACTCTAADCVPFTDTAVLELRTYSGDSCSCSAVLVSITLDVDDSCSNIHVKTNKPRRAYLTNVHITGNISGNLKPGKHGKVELLRWRTSHTVKKSETDKTIGSAISYIKPRKNIREGGRGARVLISL